MTMKFLRDVRITRYLLVICLLCFLQIGLLFQFIWVSKDPLSENNASWMKNEQQVHILDHGNPQDMFENKLSPNILFHHLERLLLSDDSFCAKAFDYGKTNLNLTENNLGRILAAVSTRVNDFDRRADIRFYWGPYIKTIFPIGRPAYDDMWEDILEEQQKFGDLIVGDFDDVYDSLPIKTMFALTWVSYFCSEIEYFVKIDSDIIFLPLNLKQQMVTWPKNSFIGGACTASLKPIRKKYRKHYVSLEEYSKESYPPFCFGSFYIMSRDVVDPIVTASIQIPYFKFEDVYVGMCAELADIRPYSIYGVVHHPLKYSYCRYKTLISSHLHQFLPPSQVMAMIDADAVLTKKQCPKINRSSVTPL